jgi:hypothetical protein
VRQVLNILILSSVVFLQACKKKDTPPPPAVVKYEMTFKKDGVKDTLLPSYCTLRPNSSVPSKTDFMFMARSKDYNIAFGIAIQVDGNITPGVYETVNGSGYYPVIADYFMNNGQVNEKDYAIDNAPGKPYGNFKVTLTYIDDKLIKGTFMCNYLYERTYDESIVITEGNFTAKRNN